MQLLQEIRQGLSGYELNRLVAIGATQRVLTKHLHKMSKHAVRMGLLFTERATKKTKSAIRSIFGSFSCSWSTEILNRSQLQAVTLFPEALLTHQKGVGN